MHSDGLCPLPPTTHTQGHVHFDPDGTRGNNSVRIEQYRPVETSESTTAAASSDLQREVVAYLVDANLSQLSYVEGESSSTLWPGIFLYSI